jgi:hypothetical protein
MWKSSTTPSNGRFLAAFFSLILSNTKLAKLWKSRKRIGDEMMSAVSEGLQKPMKVFIELADLNLDPDDAIIPKY